MTEFYLPTPDGPIYAIPHSEVAKAGSAVSAIVDWTDDEGAPAELLQAGRDYPRDRPPRWLVRTEEPTPMLVFTTSQHGEVTGWRLADPALESARLPLVHLGEPSEDDRRFYDAQFGDPVRTDWTIDVADYQPWPLDEPDEAEARPELPAGATWVPSQALSLVFGFTPMDHLIPGALTGFHRAAATAIAARPDHRGYGFRDEPPRTEGRDGRLKTSFVFPLEGLTAGAMRARRKLKKDTHRTVMVDLAVGPDVVTGQTLAHAIRRWNNGLAKVLEQLPEPGVVCGHCNGVGVIVQDGR